MLGISYLQAPIPGSPSSARVVPKVPSQIPLQREFLKKVFVLRPPGSPIGARMVPDRACRFRGDLGIWDLKMVKE